MPSYISLGLRTLPVTDLTWINISGDIIEVGEGEVENSKIIGIIENVSNAGNIRRLSMMSDFDDVEIQIHHPCY